MSRENRLHHEGCDCFICAPGDTMSDLLRARDLFEALLRDANQRKIHRGEIGIPYGDLFPCHLVRELHTALAAAAPPPDPAFDKMIADMTCEHGVCSIVENCRQCLGLPPPDRNDLLAVGRAQSQHDADGARSSPTPVPSTTALMKLIESAAHTISEMGCTCQNREEGHERGCVGNKEANDLLRAARRLKRKP